MPTLSVTRPTMRRGLATRIFVDGVDLSCYLAEASVDHSRDAFEAPAWMAPGPKVMLPGMPKATINLSGYYTADTDGATKTILRKMSTSGDYSSWVIQEEGYATNRQFSALVGPVTSYHEGRTIGEMVKFTATIEASGWIARGASAFNTSNQYLFGPYSATGLSNSYVTARSTLTQGPSNIAAVGATLRGFWMIRNNQPTPTDFYVGQAQTSNWSGTNTIILRILLNPGQLYVGFTPTTANGAVSYVTTSNALSRYSALVLKQMTQGTGLWQSSRSGLKSGHTLRSSLAPSSTTTVAVGGYDGTWGSLANYVAVSALAWPGTSATTLTVANPFFFGFVDPTISWLPNNLS